MTSFFFYHLQSDSSASGFHAAECHLTALRPLGNLSRLIARVLLKLVSALESLSRKHVRRNVMSTELIRTRAFTGFVSFHYVEMQK